MLKYLCVFSLVGLVSCSNPSQPRPPIPSPNSPSAQNPAPAARSPKRAAKSTAPAQKRPSISAPFYLVISLSKRQVELYEDGRLVQSYPIAVGRSGWETPTGEFQVMQMRRNPVWINPFTDEAIPSNDARNPLGRFWIGFWTDGRNWIGFHGTPEVQSVGTAASHGCIRMFDQDIEALFQQVQMGTPVIVEP